MCDTHDELTTNCTTGTTRETGLLLAGTPIGDTRYVSPALRDALLQADIIAAEDTRKFADLCRRADLRPSGRVVSFFEGNESERTPGLIDAIRQGNLVVLVTDAGMPSVSDPGYRLAQAAIAAQMPVSAVPGPSAVLTALAVSGLSPDRFCFEGFLPRKPGPRRTRLDDLHAETRTMVFFEAPHRLPAFLADAVAAFGPERAGAICRELTKTHEEVIRGSLADLAEWATEEVRGEVTVVIAGGEPTPADLSGLVAQVRTLVSSGAKTSTAVAVVADLTGADRRALYQATHRTTGDGS